MINVRPKIKLNGRAGGLCMRENQKMHDSAISVRHEWGAGKGGRLFYLRLRSLRRTFLNGVEGMASVAISIDYFLLTI